MTNDLSVNLNAHSDANSTSNIGVDCWILTDGAAGNVKQARVLARGLGLNSREFVVKLSALDRAFAPRFRRANFAALQLMPAPDALDCQYAIGCGRAGAIALDALKRARPAVRTVQILAPRCDSARFDAIVCPAHDRLSAPNVVSMIGALNDIDDVWLAAGRLQAQQTGFAGTLVLVGAPTRNAPYTLAQFAQLLDRLLHEVLAPNDLCISASRRTPPAFLALIRASGARVWTGASDGPNPYQAWLSSAAKIVVTPDSVNMMSEACATYAQVEAAFADTARGKIAIFLQSLAVRLHANSVAVVPLRATLAVIERLRSFDHPRG